MVQLWADCWVAEVGLTPIGGPNLLGSEGRHPGRSLVGALAATSSDPVLVAQSWRG